MQDGLGMPVEVSRSNDSGWGHRSNDGGGGLCRSGWGSLLGLVALGLAALGCQPKIGDSCELPSDCSASGERICDSTQVGGYCTIFNCDPTSCPSDESICVLFGSALSAVPGCEEPSLGSPYARSFCMDTCESDSDCRPEYRCIDISQPNGWSAQVVHENPETTKICIVPFDARNQSIPDERDNGVCTGTDGGFPTPLDAGTGTGGMAGASGAGGGGGMSSGGAAGAAGQAGSSG